MIGFIDDHRGAYGVEPICPSPALAVDPALLALTDSLVVNETEAAFYGDGITRDSGDVLIELMEFAIQWRKANGLPTTAK